MGISTAAALTTNLSVGVFGRTLGSVTTGVSIGVRGLSNAATGFGCAFYGQAVSSAAIGGITFVTSSGAGWQGQNGGTGVGVVGINTSGTVATAGSGVYGETGGTNSMGGEFYNTNAANGTALFTAGNNVAGTSLTTGSGGALNGLTTGLFANATQATNGVGVYGRSNGAGIFSVPGGVGVSGSSTLFGVSGFSTSTANATLRAGGYFDTNAGQSYAYIGARTAANTVRKIEGNGTVNTTVKDINDNLVVLSCPEAPENFFQDYGQGKLVNGFVHIDLDPILAKNIIVSNEHPLRVFIQLEGDCKGVFVTNKSGTGFDVKELDGGSSNVDFSWTITANRADEVLQDGSISKYSEERFAPAMGPQKITVQQETVSKTPRENIIQKPLDIESLDTLPKTADTTMTKSK